MKKFLVAVMFVTLAQASFAGVNCSGKSTYDKSQTAQLPCENAKQALAEAKQNAKACTQCGAKGTPAADVCAADHSHLIHDLQKHLEICKQKQQ